MTMWLSIIEQNVTKQVLQPGWAYSDGAAEEYLHVTCMQAGGRSRNNIRTVDTDNQEMTLARGINTIGDAFLDLHKKGMKTDRLAITLARLLILEERYASGELANEAKKNITLAPYSRDDIMEIKEKVMEVLKEDYRDILVSLNGQKTSDFTPLNLLVHDKPKVKKRELTLF
jgi:hypothetical protein